MAIRNPLRTTLLALACTLASGLSQAAEAPKTLSSGELKVGMEISYPPFEYYEGDKVLGFDPEVSAAGRKHAEHLSAVYFDERRSTRMLGHIVEKLLLRIRMRRRSAPTSTTTSWTTRFASQQKATPAMY